MSEQTTPTPTAGPQETAIRIVVNYQFGRGSDRVRLQQEIAAAIQAERDRADAAEARVRELEAALGSQMLINLIPGADPATIERVNQKFLALLPPDHPWRNQAEGTKTSGDKSG